MAQDEENGAEKPHEPTQKKLDDARRKGEIARSSDLTTAAAYGGVLLTGTALGAGVLTGLGAVLQALIARAPEMAADAFSGGGSFFAGQVLVAVSGKTAVLFALPALAALASILGPRSLIFAPEKLQAKLSRISPLANARQKFGRAGLFEFAKSFGKLVIYSVVLGLFLWVRLPEVLLTQALDPGQVSISLMTLTLRFFALALIVAAGIGAVDYLWQVQEHLRRNRMSRKELMDEAKQSEGDPHVKQQRRQRGYDLATNRMLLEVPKADVIVVNPHHYAVALGWSRAPGAAPVCLAKGTDELAARIREIAADAGVPIHRDPPTARALHATIAVGEEIRPEHYKPVAAAIRFAEAMRHKARARRGGLS